MFNDIWNEKTTLVSQLLLSQIVTYNEEYSKDLFSFRYHSSNAPCSAYFLDLHTHLLLICSFA